jgi:hypothetical protein
MAAPEEIKRRAKLTTRDFWKLLHDPKYVSIMCGDRRCRLLIRPTSNKFSIEFTEISDSKTITYTATDCEYSKKYGVVYNKVVHYEFDEETGGIKFLKIRDIFDKFFSDYFVVGD